MARAAGAGRREDANALVLHTLVIAVVFGMLFSILAIGFGSPLYRALGGTGEALHSALVYSDFIFLSAVPIWVVNLQSAGRSIVLRKGVEMSRVLSLAPKYGHERHYKKRRHTNDSEQCDMLSPRHVEWC